MHGPPEVVAVGHAIVDVLASSTDDQVAQLGLTKATMTLVDDERAAALLGQVGVSQAVSGGSAANTAVGLVSLGTAAAFVGKVRDDAFGQVFADDIRAAGVRFDVPAATEGPGTGRCLVLVTPDAERTMCTSLGIGDHLGAGDIDGSLVGAARVVYLEGYLCGLEHTAAAVTATLDAARAGGTPVAVSLSDPLWVQLHRRELVGVVDQVQIVFANEAEACLLAGVDNVGAAVSWLAARCETVAVTRGPAGSVVVSGGERVEVPARPLDRVIDTTGAGDLYAAGFLAGHLQGAGPEDAGRLGSVAAAEAISHIGARPARGLRSVATEAGLVS